MPFLEISGNHFRNLEPYKLEPSPNNNLIIGENGAGKTNLLESIYLNGLGRSFRTGKTNNLINNGSESCWVYSSYQANTDESVFNIGVERSRNNTQKISVNKKRLHSLAELAFMVPIITIEPLETSLVDGSSVSRRKYLDWLVFHVKQDFLQDWRELQNILKQRNRVLRDLRKNPPEQERQLSAWDPLFTRNNLLVSSYREQVFIQLKEKVLILLEHFRDFEDKQIELSLNLYPGWPEGSELRDKLKERRDSEIRRGYTSYGAHRADILIMADNTPAKEYLSRGQKKILSIILKLAQALVLKENTGLSPVILVDDMFAELDKTNIQKTISIIESLGGQSFFTTVEEPGALLSLFNNQTKVFHVKQGKIKPINH